MLISAHRGGSGAAKCWPTVLSEELLKRQVQTTNVATISELITFLQAAHVAQDTDWELDARGGIMLIAYPEQLKTTILQKALRRYPEVLLVSDMNVREFSDIREDLLTQRFDTIGFLDYQKVWERDDRTSSNVEGVIRALTDEGWHGTLGGKQIRGAAARAFMVLCMTPGLFNQKADGWQKTGFMRRFLSLKYIFKDRRILEESIKAGRAYQLGAVPPVIRPINRLQYTVTPSEADYIGLALKDQKGLVALQVLLRIYNTLKWHYDTQMKEPDRGMQLLMNVVPMLMPEGGELTIDSPSPALQVVGESAHSRKRKATKRASA